MITVDELKEKYRCPYCGELTVEKTLGETEFALFVISTCANCGFVFEDGEEAEK
jgi:transcription elongation factor Elf1